MIRSLTVVLVFGVACARQQPADAPYLNAALGAARWLSSVADTSPAGGRIPDDVSNPGSASFDLGSGSSGRSLFFLELFHATNDNGYLSRGEDELHYAVNAALTDSAIALGFYNGLAGIAFAASEFYRVTGADRFRTAALALCDVLRHRAEQQRGAATWGPVNDVLGGAAGIGLVLLHLARTFDDTAAAELARQAGVGLVQRARPGEVGWWWARSEQGALNLPNFSHGTAGVGFFLARLAAVTNDTTFLQSAERAAEYVIHIADQSDSLFLVPYGIPNDGYVTAYDIGWAHGPAGTVNLFAELARVERAYENFIPAQVRTLLASGVPDVTADTNRWSGPFRIDRRFGTSGASTFLLRLISNRPDSATSTFARQLVDDVVSRGQWEGDVLSWRLPRYGFQEGDAEDGQYTGFFYGAAGLGLVMLHMHYVDVGRQPFIEWPDDAFVSRARPFQIGR